MLLNHSHIVSHPNGDFEYIHASGGEQAGECVTHDVRRNPRHVLLNHVIGKRSAKIVAVAVFAVLGFGMQHEGRAQTVVIANEGQELSSQWDTALLAIFKVHRRGLRQMEQPSIQIEPFRDRFDNLRAAKPGMESAEQDESKIRPGTIGNQFITQRWFTECLPGSLIDAGEFDSYNRTASDDSFVHAPFEKAANDHQIAKGAASRETSTAIAVETLYIRRGNVGGGNGGIESGEENGERVRLIAGRGSAVNVHLPLVSDESLNQSLDSVANGQFRDFPNLLRSLNRFGVVAGFEADVFPDLLALDGQPVNRPTQIDSPALFSHEGDCRTWLSHFAILKRGKTPYGESSVERVTGFEPATSSLAILASDEGTVTLSSSQSPKKEGLRNLSGKPGDAR